MEAMKVIIDDLDNDVLKHQSWILRNVLEHIEIRLRIRSRKNIRVCRNQVIKSNMESVELLDTNNTIR